MSESRDGQIVTFYSFKGGTGRTMALANVAWILAANGKRVLVADWDLESPGLHRFFGPFLNVDVIKGSAGIIDLIRQYEWQATQPTPRLDGWVEDYAKVGEYAFSLRWDSFKGQGRLDFLSSGRQNSDYATAVTGLDWENFYDRLGGAEFLDALRANMRQNYDYVLLDSRTGLSDVADICTVHLPDTLITCFTLSEQGIEGAAQVAHTVLKKYPDRNIRVLPVLMRVDMAEKEKADNGRSVARSRFADLPAGMSEPERLRYWASAEVPYSAFYAYEETLATFGDAPGSPRSMLSAYEALTGYITHGEITHLPAMDEGVRLREKARFLRRAAVGDEEIVLRFAPEDQVWAEWIESLLVGMGVRVSEPDTNRTGDEPNTSWARTLTILSEAYADAKLGPQPSRDRLGGTVPLAVYVSDMRPLTEFALEHSAFVVPLDAEETAVRIAALVGRPVSPGDRPPLVGARFPGKEPDVFNAPARNTRFTGREDDIRSLRSQMKAGGRAVVLPVALQGLGGVGKTQLAIEYLHRFKNAYDVVWWIQSDPAQFVDSSLGDLAIEVKIASGSAPENARLVLQALGRGEPSDRWLLVFDNADELERVAPFLPRGRGHVLITSRNRLWGDRAHPIQVDVFHRHESVAHLRARLNGAITPEEADRIGVALGDLPIAVAAAGALLAEAGLSVADYLREIEQGGASTQSVETTWNLSLERLNRQSPAAYRMLQLCSMLSAEIALDLLSSDEMALKLAPYNPAVSERLVRSALVQDIHRLALLKLDVQAGQINVHRLLAAVLRDRMTEQEQKVARHEIHQVLAAARPRGEVDNPDSWRQFRMIWPHLEISGAMACSDEPVRELLIDRVRYLWRRNDLVQGEDLARRIEALWTDSHQGDVGQDPDHTQAEALKRQLLHLRFNLSNILRYQARFEEARDLDESVLEEQRTILGPRHPHTLMTSGSLASDLRGLGKYAEALEMDEATYQVWSDTVGEDHPRTLAAANNLATSYRLVGDYRAARDRDEKVHERRRIVLSPTNPYTLHSASCLGRDLRDGGDYARSVSMLGNVYQSLCESQGADSVDAINAQANLAVSLRASGQPHRAMELLEMAYENLDERLAKDHPDLLGCRLSRAVTLLAIDEHQRAESEIRSVSDAYEERLGPTHPHTLVCLNNLAAIARADGARTLALDSARRATEQLRQVLGADHPFTLGAATNFAICVAENGDWEQARVQTEETLARLVDTLGPEHPDTIRCQGNLAIMVTKVGKSEGSDVARAIERLSKAIGQDHPSVKALQGGGLVHRVIDPHPF